MADVTGKIMQNASDYEKRAETFKQERLAPAMEKADAASENLEPNLPRGDYTPTAAPQKGEEISDNPLKLFTNAGAALGTLLSFKSRRPLVASMEALAAAGQAINKKDYDDYAKQMQIWKDQNKLALDTAKQQSTIWKNDFSMRKGNADVLQANVRALVSAGMLDAKQAEIAGKTWESLQKHFDSVSSTAAKMHAASLAHEDAQTGRMITLAQKDSRVAQLLATYPQLMEPGRIHEREAAIASVLSDSVKGAGGVAAWDAMDKLDPSKQPGAREWMSQITGGKAVLPEAEKKVLTANLGFIREADSIAELVASRPELAGVAAGILSATQKYTTALSPTATSEEIAAASDKASAFGLADYMKNHPSAGPLPEDARVLTKRLQVLGIQQAGTTGRINQWLEKQSQQQVNPDIGAMGLIKVMETLTNDAKKLVGPLKPENMRDEVRFNEHLASTLGPDSLMQMYRDIREWQKDAPSEIPINEYKRVWLNKQAELRQQALGRIKGASSNAGQ